ncbi:MAG: hypothetical protein LW823_04950 [Rickettsiales bacterium]|jgi:hypothetical protein|nr:hypothetical protein [Rickettsiales bacterium]
MEQAFEKLGQALGLHAANCQPAMEAHFGKKPKWVVFLSACRGVERAHVACASGNQLETAFKAALDKLRKLTSQDPSQWRWIKADLVTNIEAISPEQAMDRIRKTRSNFFRRGIAFDSYFNQALLEQEINGIQTFPKDEANEEISQIKLSRISIYLKKNRKLPPLPENPERMSNWYLFDTTAYLYDRQQQKLVALSSGGYHNGTRSTEINSEGVKQLVSRAGHWLADHIHDDGRFDYGFFAITHKPIPTYNILRHCSTLYAMLEAWELTGDEAIFKPIPRALDYVINHAIRRDGNQAFLVDHEQDQEIRLGGQAALILALVKHMSLTKDERYLELAQAAAEAIVTRFIDAETGSFIHVLSGRDLSVKERFRIVYYDGEAVLALLRLYGIDQNPLWLEAARKAFERFIETDHWKHHDHWLSYATNELTAIFPEDRYFLFGLKNACPALDFIEFRDTAYPTFLELLVAACTMVKRMIALGKDPLLAAFDIERLFRVTDQRARHQSASHFFPEMAMYMAKPAEVERAFYTRHHSFRVRIDDIEHFISGYCQYHHTILARHSSAINSWRAIKPLSLNIVK